jgi:undecaprenyl-diphosphatase
LQLALGLFTLVIAIGLLQPTGLFAPADRFAMQVAGQLRAWPGTDLVTAMSGFLDRIGEPGGRLLVVLAIGMYLAAMGRPRAIPWLIVAAGATMILNPLLKLAFAAPRPDLIGHLVVATGDSFPSGHSAGSMTLYGAIALLFRARPIGWFCVVMIVATGLSRVWLGVHWPSDVVGGWIAGLAWLALVSRFPPSDEPANQPPRVAHEKSDSHRS